MYVQEVIMYMRMIKDCISPNGRLMCACLLDHSMGQLTCKYCVAQKDTFYQSFSVCISEWSKT